MDNKTKEQRSVNMHHIHGSNTKPEVILRKKLYHAGFRYRIEWKVLPGKPDIVLTKYRICIFVDGEFWHGKDFYSSDKHEGGKFRSLEEQLNHSNNSDFWIKKIKRNMERDNEITAELTGMGWTVLRFWGRDVMKNPDTCVDVIREQIFENHINDE